MTVVVGDVAFEGFGAGIAGFAVTGGARAYRIIRAGLSTVDIRNISVGFFGGVAIGTTRTIVSALLVWRSSGSVKDPTNLFPQSGANPSPNPPGFELLFFKRISGVSTANAAGGASMGTTQELPSWNFDPGVLIAKPDQILWVVVQQPLGGDGGPDIYVTSSGGIELAVLGIDYGAQAGSASPINARSYPRGWSR
jgi:hypothetical protein